MLCAELGHVGADLPAAEDAVGHQGCQLGKLLFAEAEAGHFADAHAQRAAEGVRADGDEHEFLNVERVARVCAAVEHVHQRHRERAGVLTAEIPPEGLPLAHRRGAGRRERDGEDGVCTKLRFVSRAVQLAHGLIERALLPRVEAPQQLE